MIADIRAGITFARQQPLIIADLLRRQVRRVIEMDVHDAIAAGGEDVFWGGSCAMEEKTPNIRAGATRLHFTQFFTRAKSSLTMLTRKQICECLILCERRGVQSLNFNQS